MGLSALVLVGRVLFVLLFLDSARVHLLQPVYVADYSEPKGYTPSWLVVRLSGLWLGASAILVLLGVWGDLGAFALSAHLLVTTPFLHSFWRQADPTTRVLERTRFLKHMSIVGAGLIIGGLFAHHGGPGLTLTGPLFHIG